MTFEAYFVITILIAAVVLFALEWIAPELTAVLVLVTLVASGLMSPREALAGFSSSAVIAIAALLVIGAGLVRSGAVKWMADCLGAVAGNHYRRLLLASTLMPGILSGFINIVAAVSIFTPAVLRLTRRRRLRPAGFLLPMTVSSLLGANLSLIGASHNLVVNSLLEQSVQRSFGFFEFAPLGLVLLLGTSVYTLLLPKRLLAGKKHSKAENPRAPLTRLVDIYELNQRIWEIEVQPGSAACGKALDEIGFGKRYGLSIFMVLRGDEQLPVEDHTFVLQPNDVLAIAGRPERVQSLEQENTGLMLMGQPEAEEEFTWSAFDMVEVVVPPRSIMLGQTLRQKRMRHASGLTPIALWRDGRPYRTDILDQSLQAGDAILLFGSRTRVRNFQPAPDLVWLKTPRKEEAPQRLRKFRLAAILIFIAVIAMAALGWLSIEMASLAGALAMILLGILDPAEAYRRIDWRTLILIAGMYPMGAALRDSGAAAAMADLIVKSAGAWGAIPALLAVGLLALLLTQPMHNAVAALIVTPIALQVAAALNADPKAFALSVILGASSSFLMPVGHPASLLIRKPGGYRNIDYLKFGLVPALIVLAVITGIIPLVWPLAG